MKAAIKSGLPNSADVEQHAQALIDLLDPAWTTAVSLGAHHYTEFAFIIYSYGDTQPAILFDKVLIRRIAELNAGMHVDQYYFGPDEGNEDQPGEEAVNR